MEHHIEYHWCGPILKKLNLKLMGYRYENKNKNNIFITRNKINTFLCFKYYKNQE